MGTHLVSGKGWWDKLCVILWQRLETGDSLAGVLGVSLNEILSALQACRSAPTSVNFWESVVMVVPGREEVFGEEVSFASEEVCKKLW